MLALVVSLVLFTDLSQTPPQAAPPQVPAADAVEDIQVSGEERQIFCIRSEELAQSRIRRPRTCRTQAEWGVIAALRRDEHIILLRHLGAYSMDNYLLEEAVAGGRRNALAAEDRRAAR